MFIIKENIIHLIQQKTTNKHDIRYIHICT